MSSSPVLAFPDFSKPFVLECDASGVGIGVFLMKDRHPIAFESGKSHPHEKFYSIYDKEMLAIMHALAKFRQYLVGGKFIVKADHNSLRHFLTQKELNDRQQKWVSKFQSYAFDIEYKKGKMNVVVDALSHEPALSLLQICNEWNIQLATEYSKYQFACDVLDGVN